ncbi:MAG: S-methyl-5'-thioadenosine phosphorylase [Candidatus Bathyarchaeota archaeon]|nr:MAG: S-methyl-5'-thioadenosine phosphorylase [Candidatus Bathyarchaeota archaeon]
MKNSAKANVGIITGSGFDAFLKQLDPIPVETPYGKSVSLSITDIRGRKVAILARHGANHSIPPHRINYRANIFAMHLLGVKQILATNAVGAINRTLKPGTLIVPHDFVDFTKSRHTTFYDSAPIVHIDMSEPYCPDIRRTLIHAAKEHSEDIVDGGILVCTEGPRFETPAEISLFQRLACDIVGMTSLPEAVLARELAICYASICCVSNMASGLQPAQNMNDLTTITDKKRDVLEQVLKEAVPLLPSPRSCICATAVRDTALQWLDRHAKGIPFDDRCL